MLQVKEEDIDRITEAFYLLLNGRKPSPIELPSDYPDNEVKQLVGYVNRFLGEYDGLTDMAFNLSRGDINIDAPPGKDADPAVLEGTAGQSEAFDLGDPANCRRRFQPAGRLHG